MAWSDMFSEALPPPRGDEPANLRHDITNELSDHLDCAMRRELLRTADEDEARRNVLQRFGDPKRIALKLWLDPMKEMIMKDRLMMGVIVVLTLVCVSLCILVWSSNAHNRETNEAILARLEALTPNSLSPSALQEQLTKSAEFTKSFTKSLMPAQFDENTRLTIVKHKEQREGTLIEILGTIRNDDDKTWQSIRLMAEYYDAAGEFVDKGTGYVLERVRPSEESNFKLKFYCGENIDQYDHYEIKVVDARGDMFR